MDNIENKYSLHRGLYCTKKFCISVREHVAYVINCEKKKMLPLTEKSHQDSTICYICRKKLTQKLAKDANHQKVRDHCHFIGKYRGAAHSICNLRFNVPNEIPVGFHNGSNYDYHFIMKELANEFKGQFICLGENTEKYKPFSVPIEKEFKKVDKDGNEDITTVSYKIKFVDSAEIYGKSWR